MEWTKKDTLKFIELWHGFPCLWNRKSAEYKQSQKRRDALSYIAQQMNIKTIAIEKKIMSLKTQYNREINKLKTKSGAGLHEVAQSSWYAFEYLVFLNDIDPLMINETVYEQNVNLKDENKDRHTESITQLQSQSRSIHKRKLKPQSGTLRLLKDASGAIITQQKKDEFSIFGETVASELRGIRSLRDSLLLKRAIMDLVFKTKLEILDSQNALSDKGNTLES